MMYLSDDDDESEEHVSICKNCNELVRLICKCQQLILSQYILLLLLLQTFIKNKVLFTNYKQTFHENKLWTMEPEN